MTINKIARSAGFLYLIVVIMGILNLGVLPSKLIEWDNAGKTLINVSTHQTLFKYWILTGMVCYIAFLLLPFVLYRLLKSVNKNYAVLMVILASVSVPIALLNINNQFSVLTLVNNANLGDIAQVGIAWFE